MDKQPAPAVVPALPGFWLHLVDKEPDERVPVALPARMAVIAWLIETRFDVFEWRAIATPITQDGTTTQEYFLEQPDGSCISADFTVATVAEAWEAISKIPA